jgi:50S ribosomal protein L16 3-hydroxylase
MKKSSTPKTAGMNPKPPAQGPNQGLLGKLSVEQFLQNHWQRKPLLVRSAIPEMQTTVMVPNERLFEHAASDAVESRLVSQRGQATRRWSVEYGPFDTLPSIRSRNWTVLVQGMDLVEDAAHEILQRFRFIPDARLDDVMISFATAGGGVGPHVDSYDVFLVQATGHRRWGIGPAPRPQWVDGLPLRILQNWAPTETHDLGPGDLLYLPPGWGHDGVALDACTTWSIGFRTPSRQEFLSAWLGDQAELSAELAGTLRDSRFRDPKREPTEHPAQVPNDLRETIHQWVEAWRADERTRLATLDTFIGRHLTEPKPHVFFDPPGRPLAEKRFIQFASRHGVALDRRTRMLYDQHHLFVNGEVDSVKPSRPIRLLADQRAWTASQATKILVNELIIERVYSWYLAGWIFIRAPQLDTD